jgi:Uma2 family endonuclease
MSAGLKEDDRIELIEGELIDMAPIGYLHASLTSLIFQKIGYATEGRALARSQNPISFGPSSEPQPDFALLKPHHERYRTRLPMTEDTLLIVEIADASPR